MAGGLDQGQPACRSDWNRRRLIIFTEYEDTRRWLERRLREALADTDRADDRIGVFTGATGSDRREEVKRAFNADPDVEPLRILICTDAAREGINLQTYCSDLIHFDLPWNPSRLEQRNGRIDRKLQPAKQIVCRYFRYEQREADIVLEALVRKTETIREQLGSVGQVIEDRITKRLAESGIGRGQAAALARAISEENDAERLARARAEMDDEERARHERLLQEQDDLRRALERSRERVGVDPEDLQRVAAAALSRAGLVLDSARGEPVGNVAYLPPESRRSRLRQGCRLGRCIRRSADPSPQAWRTPRRMAAQCADTIDRVRAAGPGRRSPRRPTWCRCISNIGLSGGCCRVSSARDFSRSCRASP